MWVNIWSKTSNYGQIIFNEYDKTKTTWFNINGGGAKKSLSQGTWRIFSWHWSDIFTPWVWISVIFELCLCQHLRRRKRLKCREMFSYLQTLFWQILMAIKLKLNEVDELTTSQTAHTDTPITTQRSVDNNHQLKMWSCIVAELQASLAADSTVQAMVGSMEELIN